MPDPDVTPVPEAMLAPYRVLDLTDARAELATFVFAGLGADVKAEPRHTRASALTSASTGT